MAYTQADLDAIKAAIKSGAQRVDLPSVGSVSYRTLAEMQQIQALIQKDVDAANAPGTRPMRRRKIVSYKDL
jgi:hypothetical protein